jgi:excisionase family DNA binding protein
VLHKVRDVQKNSTGLLTARQVQLMFDVDRSTVYRMAAQGVLPALKIGRQWRFPAEKIERLADHGIPNAGRQADRGPLTIEVADAVAAVAAELLGVTMVVTDMQGTPITGAANACARLSVGAADGAFLAQCLAEWKLLAEAVDMEPRFRLGPLGFECARAFVRSGTTLVAMVVAGGVAADGDASTDLHHLDGPQRRAVLAALPRIAAVLSNTAAGRASAAHSLDPAHLPVHRTSTQTREAARAPMEVTQ